MNALRSAAGEADLPFLTSYKYRSFPLPLPKAIIENIPVKHSDDLGRPKTCPVPVIDQPQNDVDYEALIDESALLILNCKYPYIPNPPETVQDLVRLKLRRLCGELSVLDGSHVPKLDTVNSNISVRHVQPMAAGKHFQCKNVPMTEPEVLLKRSPATFRKILFDQTARMFQPNPKGVLVYDVLDHTVAQNIGEGTLLFDSRFESGNLQLAIKVSQFEYDLLLETDINSSPGRHNQVLFIPHLVVLFLC